MKKISLLLATAVVLFFVSCEEKELTSLEGTKWKERYERNGTWSQVELTFTSTHATYVETNSANNYSEFTGTYTFNPPVIVIVSDHWTFWGNSPVVTINCQSHHEGTVSGKIMTIGIHHYGDVIAISELKRQ